jgi:hypothetical protein
MTTVILYITNSVAFLLAFYFLFKCRRLEKKILAFEEELEKQNLTVDFFQKIIGDKKFKKKSSSSGFFNLFEK